MEPVPDGERGGAFVCHLAAVMPGGNEIVFEGEVRGSILRERKGDNGFGYDPVFLPTGRQRTTAEMSQDEKAAISHRGIAARKFIAWLKDINSLRNLAAWN
jgi:XTP/dITP diphosphohydrolase